MRAFVRVRLDRLVQRCIVTGACHVEKRTRRDQSMSAPVVVEIVLRQ